MDLRSNRRDDHSRRRLASPRAPPSLPSTVGDLRLLLPSEHAVALLAGLLKAGIPGSCGASTHRTPCRYNPFFWLKEKFTRTRDDATPLSGCGPGPIMHHRGDEPSRCRSSGRFTAGGPMASRARSTSSSICARRADASLRRSRPPPLVACCYCCCYSVLPRGLRAASERPCRRFTEL